MEEIKSEIRGAELKANCVVTSFRKVTMAQKKTSCSIKASWDTGVFSIAFNDGGKRKMVSIRMDELTMVMKAASDARKAAESEEPSE